METMRNTKLRTKVLASILVGVLMVGMLLLQSANWTPSRTTYPVQGIDV